MASPQAILRIFRNCPFPIKPKGQKFHLAYVQHNQEFNSELHTIPL